MLNVEFVHSVVNYRISSLLYTFFQSVCFYCFLSHNPVQVTPKLPLMVRILSVLLVKVARQKTVNFLHGYICFRGKSRFSQLKQALITDQRTDGAESHPASGEQTQLHASHTVSTYDTHTPNTSHTSLLLVLSYICKH